MKKLVVSTLFVLTLFLSTVSMVGAISWSSTETYTIPSWGNMSKPSSATKTKDKVCAYGYMEAISDQSSLSKYGDFVNASSTSTRVTDNKYKVHVNSLTKMHYTTSYRNNTNLKVKARASGEVFEPSAGTIIRARFSAVN